MHFGGQRLVLQDIALKVCHTLEEQPTPCFSGRDVDQHGRQSSKEKGATVLERAGTLSQSHHNVNVPMTAGCASL